MAINDSLDVLKRLYNEILSDSAMYDQYAVHSLDGLSKTIAMAKYEAYSDVLAVIKSYIAGLS